MAAFPDSLSGSQIVSSKRFPTVPFVLFMAGMVVFGFSGCKRPSADSGSGPGQNQGSPAVSSPKLTLPIQRALTDQQGRKVEVTIVKRTPTHISIIRKSDEKSFELETGNLSEADRIFIEKLPVSGTSRSSAFVENRQAEIRKLEEEIQQHNNSLESGALNGSQTSMTNGKIERLNREILELQKQIAEHGK